MLKIARFDIFSPDGCRMEPNETKDCGSGLTFARVNIKRQQPGPYLSLCVLWPCILPLFFLFPFIIFFLLHFLLFARLLSCSPSYAYGADRLFWFVCCVFALCFGVPCWYAICNAIHTYTEPMHTQARPFRALMLVRFIVAYTRWLCVCECGTFNRHKQNRLYLKSMVWFNSYASIRFVTSNDDGCVLLISATTNLVDFSVLFLSRMNLIELFHACSIVAHRRLRRNCDWNFTICGTGSQVNNWSITIELWTI